VRAAALTLALAVAGCATMDVYSYRPRPLPEGTEPLAAVADSLRELRDVSWSWGEGDPDPGRRAVLAQTPRGVTVQPHISIATGSPLDLSYEEIVDGVRMVTQLHGSWTVFIYDRHNRLVQMEFNSYRSARLFLDAATALSRS
jgi:hypothetical protein